MPTEEDETVARNDPQAEAVVEGAVSAEAPAPEPAPAADATDETPNDDTTAAVTPTVQRDLHRLPQRPAPDVVAEAESPALPEEAPAPAPTPQEPSLAGQIAASSQPEVPNTTPEPDAPAPTAPEPEAETPVVARSDEWVARSELVALVEMLQGVLPAMAEEMEELRTLITVQRSDPDGELRRTLDGNTAELTRLQNRINTLEAGGAGRRGTLLLRSLTDAPVTNAPVSTDGISNPANIDPDESRRVYVMRCLSEEGKEGKAAAYRFGHYAENDVDIAQAERRYAASLRNDPNPGGVSE